MKKILLIQLPIPQQNVAIQTGNVPLAGGYLKASAQHLSDTNIHILPESIVSYLGDQALLDYIAAQQPDIVGFTVFGWNLFRSLWLARACQEKWNCRIILGGPEITQDNPFLQNQPIDFLCYGDGEAVFQQLLTTVNDWSAIPHSLPADSVLADIVNPYSAGFLEPHIENCLFLETTRGCPYRCSFCYYNKSRERLFFFAENQLLHTIEWAHQQQLQEVFLLDPSLNVRPYLLDFLEKIAAINADKQLAFHSEIRPENIDATLANAFAQAGFKGFEIGLQSTNPKALAAMNRPTNLAKTLQGIRHLQDAGITPKVDLILGLPGDDPEGFRKSVDFVADHHIDEAVQVFALAILPGTEFRKKANDLGLQYQPYPPYYIQKTPTFDQSSIFDGFAYAEDRFDISLAPLPYVDLSYRLSGEPNFPYISKLFFQQPQSEGLESVAQRLTNPYQIMFDATIRDETFVQKTVEHCTNQNPFSVPELVFFEPNSRELPHQALDFVKIHRPHFLDNDLQYHYYQPGNRACIITVVSESTEKWFFGPMKRQIFWWRQNMLPDIVTLENLLYMDGIFIDNVLPESAIHAWQQRIAPRAEEFPALSFASVADQKAWQQLTAADCFYTDIHPQIAIFPSR